MGQARFTAGVDAERARLAEYLAGRKPFGVMIRYRRQVFDLETELELVETIGKFRDPRFVIDEGNRFAYANLVRWCCGDPAMRAIDPRTMKPQEGDLKKGVFIAGKTGTGKSWCLEILSEYARFRGFEVAFPKDQWEREMVNRPLAWTVVRADQICRHFAKEGDIAKYELERVLGIQDLGQEPPEILHMGNRQNVLAQLLEYRGDQIDQLTLITSNLDLTSDDFVRLYGERVQSRLFGMCNFLPIQGEDRRR